ncbi:MAG: hypothetical protein Ct9H300mP28_15840 [Pseudomonadota bacterium]|nr:MAG: hypothetical protein Ct9H300mP28_15840 [Pseudomonadota bacterium]
MGKQGGLILIMLKCRISLGDFSHTIRPQQKIDFGIHKGQPVWQEVPGEYRSELRRLIVTQGILNPLQLNSKGIWVKQSFTIRFKKSISG